MLRTTFLLCLSLSTFFTFSQVNIINRSLTDSSLNIAYIGVDNAIELTGLKNNNNILSFSTTNGTITNFGQNRYVLRPIKYGECTLTFTEKGKTIAKRVLKTDTLSELRAQIAGIRDSVVSINQILVNPFLIINMPGSYYKHGFYIVSFTATFIGQNYDSVKTYVVGNLFSEEQIKIIKQLRSRDRIFFDNLRVLCPNCRTRKFPPFIINIK